MKKKLGAAAIVAAGLLMLTGCTSADIASQNLSKDADSFKINRLVVLHNDIQGTDTMKIEGLCSLGNDDKGSEHTVTCKIGKDKYVKELLFLGRNDTLTAIQTEPSSTDPYHYTIIFKPGAIVPHLEVQTSGGDN